MAGEKTANVWRQAGKYMNLGLVFSGCILIPTAAGYWLDGALEVKGHWFFLGGLALGFAAGVYQVVKTAVSFEKEAKEKQAGNEENKK